MIKRDQNVIGLRYVDTLGTLAWQAVGRKSPRSGHRMTARGETGPARPKADTMSEMPHVVASTWRLCKWMCVQDCSSMVQ